MPTVLLVRHGRTSANAAGVLAGRTPGVTLDETGVAQAAALATRLAGLRVQRIVSSPAERTLATARAIAATLVGPRRRPAELITDDRLAECDYGDWTGRRIAELTREPMWKTVQAHPSAAVFPGGEALAEVARRAVGAVRDHDRQVGETAGRHALFVVVSHGDVIKAVLADALGLHLDGFQRIVVDPCSVSVVRYTELRPFVLVSNGTGDGLAGLSAHSRRSRAGSDAVVGGGAGSG